MHSPIPPADQNEPVVRVGQLTLYPEKYEVRTLRHPLRLTASEFRVLLLLARRASRVVRRDELKQCLRNDTEASSDRALDNTVSRLRQKIAHLHLRVTAVRGVGYELAEAAEPATE